MLVGSLARVTCQDSKGRRFTDDPSMHLCCTAPSFPALRTTPKQFFQCESAMAIGSVTVVKQ